jgi:23S rRNA (pseudouridine1915-N3)-methyltransferase
MVVVGRDRRDPLVLVADEYLERIRHYFPIELVEVREEPAKASTPVERVRLLEAERLERALAPGELVIALDERGASLGSVELAEKLGRWAREGLGSVALVIGGPNGLDPAWVARARERWSLSRLTLPHRMARLVLAEQLYRACTILRGEPYHK